ncbi:DNA-binding protein [Spinellus fusiger]|nr:DNA-binding protein [Spinellus fusiger]
MENRTLTFEGSASYATEYFEYCIYSILYQRGIYPEDEFTMTEKYGMKMITTTNKELQLYVHDILLQVRDEPVERWQFDVKANKHPSEHVDLPTSPSTATEEKEQFGQAFRSTIRQITATVSFLPLLTDKCTINIQVYTDTSVTAQGKWGASSVALLKGGGEHMRLKTLVTSSHQVETIVSYQMGKES